MHKHMRRLSKMTTRMWHVSLKLSAAATHVGHRAGSVGPDTYEHTDARRGPQRSEDRVLWMEGLARRVDGGAVVVDFDVALVERMDGGKGERVDLRRGLAADQLQDEAMLREERRLRRGRWRHRWRW